MKDMLLFCASIITLCVLAANTWLSYEHFGTYNLQEMLLGCIVWMLIAFSLMGFYREWG